MQSHATNNEKSLFRAKPLFQHFRKFYKIVNLQTYKKEYGSIQSRPQAEVHPQYPPINLSSSFSSDPTGHKFSSRDPSPQVYIRYETSRVSKGFTIIFGDDDL